MEFFRDIWTKMGNKYLATFDATLAPLLAVGFKAKRGEKTIPLELVREFVRDAYVQGAETALKMSKEIGS